MALDMKDIQREVVLADIICDRDNMILSQANVIQQSTEKIKVLEARIKEFETRLNKDVINEPLA